MFLKSWSVLGINTKDKTISRPQLISDTNSLVATQDMILFGNNYKIKNKIIVPDQGYIQDNDVARLKGDYST